MEFDYYHEAEAGSKEFEEYFKFIRTVALEDLELAERAQINLNISIYTEGLLNPNKENRASYYQTQVLDMCSAEYEKEQETGHKVVRSTTNNPEKCLDDRSSLFMITHFCLSSNQV